MSRHTCLALALCGLAVVACARQQSATSTPSPAATTTPFVALTATPSVTTAAPASAAPAVAPTVAARTNVAKPAPTLTPDPPPKILSVSRRELVVHGGDVVRERIVASPNTASVEARIGGYSMSLPKTGVGTFSLDYKVPWLPFFIHGGYDLVLIARNTEGVQTRQTVRVSVE